ncbi:MAG: asparagine synthetase B, partial [Candidatus Muiribacteriaceae bacterium]
MCGFSGLIDSKVWDCGTREKYYHSCENIIKVLSHRGPDDSGIFLGGRHVFVHTRLSIIDPGHGQQPFYSDDRKRSIVYNGELYNQEYLRSLLMSDGVMLKTDCDTEILFRLLERYGRRCLDMIDGMFSFVYFDEDTGKAIAARDICGEKPLFYSLAGGRFAFSSELKGLKGLVPEFRKDRESIVRYFTYQYIPA